MISRTPEFIALLRTQLGYEMKARDMYNRIIEDFQHDKYLVEQITAIRDAEVGHMKVMSALIDAVKEGERITKNLIDIKKLITDSKQVR